MRKLSPLILALLLLVTWQVAADLYAKPILLPSPAAVAGAFVEYFSVLVTNGLITLGEAIVGFLAGSLAAIFLASLGSFFPSVRRAIFPYAVAIKVTPIIVLAPILTIWISSDLLSKLAMATLICFFPVLVNTSLGLQAVEKDWVDLMKLHHATKWDIFWRLRLPNALPEIFAGLRTAVSLSMVGAVVAEFTGANEGLGHMIQIWQGYNYTNLVFAGVFVISVLGLFMYYTVVFVHNRVVFWQREN